MSFTTRNLYQKLQRVTMSGIHLEGLDGLRFFAILWVALYHLHGSLPKKAPAGFLIDNDSWFYALMVHGRQGVPIFFALSGFFLCLPFAKQFVLQARQVSLKAYYARRLMRIAPPYWIATIAVACFYFVLGKYSLSFLIPRVAASLGFVYTFIFDEINILNSAFWALEVEMQFYLVAPLLVWLYFTMAKTPRRIAVLVIIALAAFIQAGFNDTIVFTLPNFIQYFLAGFLVCDMYVSKDEEFFQRNWLPALAVLPFILFATYDDSLIERIAYPLLIVILCLSILSNPFWMKTFGWKPAVAIGGISYTIYLIHFPIIGFIGRYTMPIPMSGNYYVDFLIQCILILPVVFMLSFIFYLAAERPFMKIRPYQGSAVAETKLSDQT